MVRFDPDPVVVGETQAECRDAVHVQAVLGQDLPQPRVLRVPRVVHHHRPLGDRVQRILVGDGAPARCADRAVRARAFERGVPEGQRIEILGQALAIDERGRLRPVVKPLSREAELLQRLRIHLQDHLHRRVAEQRMLLRELEVVLVRVTVIAHVLRPAMHEETLVLDVALPLLRIGLAAQGFVAVLAAPSGKKPDARYFLVVDDEILVVGELARAVGVGERGKLEPGRQLDQNFLPRPDVAIRIDDGLPDRVRRCVGLGDRPVEQRDRVVALEVRRIRQDQVGEAHRLRVERIDDDQKRDDVLSALVLLRQHFADPARVHRRIPCHVGHEQQQRVNSVRIAFDGVGDHHVHQAVGRERRLP